MPTPIRQSCGTCKDRRIRCDLASPTCANCAKANRHCQGYGLRLSWPRGEKSKRAIVAKLSPESKYPTNDHNGGKGDLFFINMQAWHISSWLSMVNGTNEASYERIIEPPSPRTLSLSLIGQDDSNLIYYYTQSGHRFLLTPPLGSLTPLLLQIGLSDSSPSSKAVLNSILALSCLHLRGDRQASVYKLRATSLLRASLDLDGSIKAAISNLVCSMLLYLYETVHRSNSTAWAIYLCGVKKILQSKIAIRGANADGSQIIFNWVYYHETIAQFGQLYWRQHYQKPICRGKLSRNLQQHSAVAAVNSPSMIGCSPVVLDSISNIFDLTMWRELPSQRQELLAVEVRLKRELTILLKVSPFDDTNSRTHTATVLHCLAALIYMNRATLGYNGTEPSHQALVSQGLGVLSKVAVCETPWPLFIIACEVMTDEQRLVIMETISRSKKESGTGHLDLTQSLVEAVWNYDDLDPDVRLDYNEKLQSIVQAAPWMPPFA